MKPLIPRCLRSQNRGLALFVAALALSTQASAASSSPALKSIDFDGRTWTLPGQIKTTIGKTGSNTQFGDLTLSFAGSGFTLRGPQGDEVQGTYSASGKNVADLAPVADSLEQFLRNVWQEQIQAGGSDITIDSIALLKTVARARATSVATGIALNLAAKIQGTVNLTVEGTPAIYKFTTRITGKGILVTPIAGTTWTLAYSSKLSVKRLRKVSDTGTLQLLFGPQMEAALGEGEFLIQNAEQGSLRGAFTTDGRQNVFLVLTSQAVEEPLADLVSEAAQGEALNVSTSLTNAAATAKVKHGLSIALKVALRFVARGEVDGALQSTTGTYALKGLGAQLDL